MLKDTDNEIISLLTRKLKEEKVGSLIRTTENNVTTVTIWWIGQNKFTYRYAVDAPTIPFDLLLKLDNDDWDGWAESGLDQNFGGTPDLSDPDEMTLDYKIDTPTGELLEVLNKLVPQDDIYPKGSIGWCRAKGIPVDENVFDKI